RATPASSPRSSRASSAPTRSPTRLPSASAPARASASRSTRSTPCSTARSSTAEVAVDRALYLHEIIDIVGLGAWPYMRHTLAASGDEKVNFELQGTFYTMGITGRWSQVVNLWDVPGGWDGWHTAVDRLNLARPANQD